mmetsp:Transcript_13954/g.21540  ORF Transcript_13954/g.21540 Transcript_13954/m.21540 type:complete len:90 (+) Transcript_13954:32-301(+)
MSYIDILLVNVLLISLSMEISVRRNDGMRFSSFSLQLSSEYIESWFIVRFNHRLKLSSNTEFVSRSSVLLKLIGWVNPNPFLNSWSGVG